MNTKYDYLMNIATALYLICYIPELYANYKNKNANLWNVPEKVLILVGTTFAFSYGVVVKDDAIIINYAPLVALDAVALGMRIYYACHKKASVEICQCYIPQVSAKSSTPGSNSGSDDSRQTTSLDKTEV